MPTQEETREALIRSAKKLFCKKGFSGTTVKDIVDDAGVNISLVSYYFQGKEGLYAECISQFGQHRLELAKKILQKPESKAEFKVRLEMWVREIIRCHLEEPDLTHLIHRECDVNFERIESVFQQTFSKIFETLVLFVTEAQAIGVCRKELNPKAMSQLLFGSAMHLVRSDQLTQKLFGTGLQDQEYQDRVVQHYIDVFLFGVLQSQAG